MELLKFQKKFVENKSRLKIIHGDRGSAKTVTIFADLLSRECNSVVVFLSFAQMQIFAEDLMRDIFTMDKGWGYNGKDHFFYNERAERVIYLIEFKHLDKLVGLVYHHLAFINIPLYELIMFNKVTRHGKKIDITVDFFGLTDTYIYYSEVDDNPHLSDHFKNQSKEYTKKLKRKHGN